MKLGGIYVSIGAKVDSLKKDLDKAEGMVAKTGVVMQRTIGNISFAQVGIAAAAAVGAMVLLEKKIITIGREFETNMKTVQAWSGASGKSLQDLTNIAREMGATTEWTATQAAGALKYLAAAGFSAAESIKALPGTLDLATAGQVDLATATDITTDVLTAFGLGVEDLSRVNDAFINTTSNSNTNVSMLGQSMKMVAPTAKLFGLSIEQTSAFLGTLANAGVKAEMAGSGLNMVLLKSSIAAKKLGLEALTPLIDVLKEMKTQQWDATKIGEAFGARQVKTAAILMDGIKSYERLLKIQELGAGATERLAAIIRDTLDNDMKVLASTIDGVLLDAYDRHNAEIRNVVQGITGWINENKDLIAQIIDLSKNVLMLFIDAIEMVVDAFSLLAEWIRKDTEDLKWFASILPEASTGVTEFYETIKEAPSGDVAQFFKILKDGTAEAIKGHEDLWEVTKETNMLTVKELGLTASAEKKFYEQMATFMQKRMADKLALTEEEKKLVDSFYKDMGATADGYYKHETEKLDEQVEKFEKVGLSKKKIAEWYANEVIKINDRIEKDFEEKNELDIKLHEYTVKQLIKEDNEYIDAYNATLEAATKFSAEEAKARIELEEKALSSMTRSNENYFEYKQNSLDREKQKYEDLYGKDLPWITEAFAQKYIDLELEKMRASDDFFAGVKAGLYDITQDTITWGEVGYEVITGFIADSTTALSDTFFSVITGDFEDIGELWDKVWENMLKTFTDALAEMVIKWAMSGIADFFGLDLDLGGGSGGGGGGGAGSSAAKAATSAVGKAAAEKVMGWVGGGTAATAAETAAAAEAALIYEATPVAEAVVAGQNTLGGLAPVSGAFGGWIPGAAIIWTVGPMLRDLFFNTEQQSPSAMQWIEAWEQLGAGQQFQVPNLDEIWTTPSDSAIESIKQNWIGQFLNHLIWGGSGTGVEGGEGYPSWVTSGPGVDTADSFLSADTRLADYAASMIALQGQSAQDYYDTEAAAGGHATGGPLLANEMYWPKGGGGEGLFWGGVGEGVVSQSGMQTLAEINNGTFANNIINAVNSAGGGSDRPINLSIQIDGNEIVNVVAKYGPGDSGFRDMIGGIPH